MKKIVKISTICTERSLRFMIYRVSSKFSFTLYLPFVAKQFISMEMNIQSLLITIFISISCPPFLKISFGSSRHGFSYSLWGNSKSNSKFTHQLIMDSPHLITVLLRYDSEINGLWKVVLDQTTFSSLTLAVFQNPSGYLNQTM